MKIKPNGVPYFLICSSLLLVTYSVLKAWLIPFTWDEIYSYEHYVRKGFTVFHHYTYMDANNHLLNTWLMELCDKLFGNNEFLLRLPNLIS